MHYLFYKSNDGTVIVIETKGEESDQIVADEGPDLSNWPEDLGMYAGAKKTGFYMWEGQIDKDDKFSGKVRIVATSELDGLIVDFRN